MVEIPTNKPMIREDLEDSVYKTEDGKFLAIIDKVKEIHATGQPILIGTISVEKSEKYHLYLIELESNIMFEC